MAQGRIIGCALTGLLMVSLMSPSVAPVQAGSRDGAIVGAGAAGLAIGLILGGAASSQPPADSSGTKTYRRPQTREPAQTRSASPQASYTRAEIEKIQEALVLLGYDAGTVDGSLGRKTQLAIVKFQSDKKFPQTGQLSKVEHQVLISDVAAKQRAAEPTPVTVASIPNTGSESRSTNPQEVRPPPRTEEIYWETVRSSKSAAEFEDYIKRFPGGPFATLAMLRLEQLKAEHDQQNQAKIEKPNPSPTTTDGGPQAALPVISDASYPRANKRRPEAVAVIIGNQAYKNGVPAVEYGLRDAEAIKLLAMKTLGIDSSNIIAKQNATRAELDLIFGTDKDHKGMLWRTIDPDGASEIVVFYSGHGAPGSSASDGNFLLPVDGDPNHASLNGYPLSQLYQNLGLLKARSITVYLDACFSGQSPDANSTSLIKHASPVYISKATPSDASKINVFTAANERQLSSWDTEAGHGIFTKFVLTGLAGEADENKDKIVSAKELYDYLGKQVRRSARRKHGREQDPQFTGNEAAELASF